MCIYIYIYYICIHIHTRIHIRISLSLYIYIYIYRCAYIHTHKHTPWHISLTPSHYITYNMLCYNHNVCSMYAMICNTILCNMIPCISHYTTYDMLYSKYCPYTVHGILIPQLCNLYYMISLYIIYVILHCIAPIVCYTCVCIYIYMCLYTYMWYIICGITIVHCIILYYIMLTRISTRRCSAAATPSTSTRTRAWSGARPSNNDKQSW